MEMIAIFNGAVGQNFLANPSLSLYLWIGRCSTYFTAVADLTMSAEAIAGLSS